MSVALRDALVVMTADLRHMTASWDASSRGVWEAALPRILVQGRFRTVLLFRLSALAHESGWRGLALWLQSRGQRATGAELHPAAKIGPGFSLAHGSGVVVGHQVRAGSGLVLFQGVTLGHGRDGAGQPQLGDRVRIFAGAVVIGPVRVGDGAVIGANAVVIADVPAGARVVGVWK